MSKCRAFNVEELKRQIGWSNLFAISGGRVYLDGATYNAKYGEVEQIELPVGYGYRVRITLGWDDTWTVQRVIVKNTKKGISENIKGTVEGVYFDEVGEIAYKASRFQDVEFGKIAENV